MGKYKIGKGYGYFQNNQSGSVSVAITSTNGSGTVTFPNAFKKAPKVALGIASATENTATVTASSITPTSCTIRVRGASDTGTVEVHWVALDYTEPSKI